jgi:hypothetical protein
MSQLLFIAVSIQFEKPLFHVVVVSVASSAMYIGTFPSGERPA